MDPINGTSKTSNDAWLELQAFKSRQLNRKEKLTRHKKSYEEIINGDNNPDNTSSTELLNLRSSIYTIDNRLKSNISEQIARIDKPKTNYLFSSDNEKPLFDHPTSSNGDENQLDFESVECLLLLKLCDVALKLPIDSKSLLRTISRIKGLKNLSLYVVENFLQKFAFQELITIEEPTLRDRIDPNEDEYCIFVTAADHTKLVEFDKSLGSIDNLRALLLEANQSKNDICQDDCDASLNSKVPIQKVNRGYEQTNSQNGNGSEKSGPVTDKFSSNSHVGDSSNASKEDVESLLNLHSTKEKESKKLGEELLELLSKPTAKERNLMERFRSADGYKVQEFCPKGTKDECRRCSIDTSVCTKLHFKKIIAKHTEESLGDCSFLNTCFHMDSCKYVHYKVDYDHNETKNNNLLKSQNAALSQNGSTSKKSQSSSSKHSDKGSKLIKNQEAYSYERIANMKKRFKTIIYPPQWVQCDLRYFDMSLLGKFSVVMADPPWDIHMELPYGTMSDDEMRKLNIPTLQDEGVIFLWVTGRAMELGRECLSLWGYERIDEIIWVKTNQLQRIIRTGRTGHWLNHGKEHCLVGIKGKPKDINRGLDCDVIVAEVRATSHKPDEIYGIIERLSPGTRKIELFARQHNVQPNWISVGNQLDGVHLVEPDLINVFKNLDWPFETPNGCV